MYCFGRDNYGIKLKCFASSLCIKKKILFWLKSFLDPNEKFCFKKNQKKVKTFLFRFDL
jgi:hypothetical protein